MNEDTRHLLQECEAGCRMAVESIDQIQDYVSDEKLAEIIEKYREKHGRLEGECHELLIREQERGKAPNPAAKAMSWLGTEVKLIMDSGETKIAEIFADGCNMGIKNISGFENQYPEASGESRRIAERLIKAEEDFSKALREFM